MEQTSDLIIRPAEPGDREKVFLFLEEVWEGEDYLPLVWDDWLADSKGQLVVAELNGEPIGTGRIADLGWGEYWLEGLRVSSAHRGRGVAGQIQEYLLEFWERSHGKSIGYLTHKDTVAVHRLARKAGFKACFSVGMVRWGAVEGAHDFEPCEDRSLASKRLLSWSQAHGLHGRMETRWAYPKISLERLLRHDLIYCWRQDRGLAVLEHDEEDGVVTVALASVSLSREDVDAFLIDLARLCSMLGVESGRWFAPHQWLETIRNSQAGMRVVDDIEMICYMKER
jgi:GNAT superfamily N-acetyltransferase